MLKELFVLSLMVVIPLNAHAQIVNDGTDHVDVYDYPFDITVLEGGSFTLHNENRTGNINIVSHGWFDRHIALENSTVTVQLTDEMFPDIYYVSDIMDNSFYSTIKVKEIPQPQLNTTSSETVGTYTPFVEEPIVKQNITTIDEIFISNEINNSYVRMIGIAPQGLMNFSFFNSNGILIDVYTHTQNNDGKYEVIWRILNNLPNGFYTVEINGEIRSFEWRSINTSNITPVNIINEPVVEDINIEEVDKEVLDLRLRILQVIESIFRIVLD